MPDFRVDFKVKGDLVLEEGTTELRYAAGMHSFVFSNANEQVNGHAANLLVSVVGPYADLEGAIDVFRALLADQLDLLAFVTQHRSEIVGPTMAMEWTPGPGDRAFRAFASQDSRWPPAPSLAGPILDSVKRLADCELPRHVLAALRSFRAGLLQRSPEVQVQQYWIAFERVIDGGKADQKVSVTCAHCQAALSCAACRKQLLKTPMAKALMVEFLCSGLGEDKGVRMFKAFDFARNRLFHGATAADTERRLQSEHGMSLGECAEHLGRASYWAIYRATAPLFPKDDPVHLFIADSLVSMDMQFTVAGVVPHAGPADHPALPKIDVTIQSGFNEPAAPTG